MSKPGKYDHVIASLPRMLGEDPVYQQKVQAIKDAMRVDPDYKIHASFLAREYAAIRAEKERAAAALSEVNLRLEAVSQLMFDQYEVEGVTSMDVDGRSVACRLVPYAKAEDKEAFRQWCLADADLARKMVLPWATVNKLSGDMLANGEELPPGITVFAKQRFTLSGSD
jgi:hypothetical protein